MDAFLRELFDIQRFACDPVLQSVIDGVETRYAEKSDKPDKRELSINELDIAAAGQPRIRYPEPGREKEL